MQEDLAAAGDFALDRGLAHELSNLVRGIATFSLAQGIQPGHMLRQAMRTLQANGVPETDPAMLHLHLAKLGSLVGYDEPERVRRELLEFVQLVEKNGELELLFWAYERLGFNGIDTPSGRQELLEWSDQLASTAMQLGDEVLIELMALYKLWVRNENGLPLDKERLEKLLPYYELNYADTLGYFTVLILLCSYYSANEAYEQAIHYGKLRQNLAKRWQDTFTIGGSSFDLARIYLKAGRKDDAGSVLMEAIDWHLAVGQVWQTLGVLWSIALEFPQLVGIDLAIQVLSMAYHHPETISYYKWRIEDERARFEAEMEAAFAAASWEKGRGMDFDTAVSLVRSALS